MVSETDQPSPIRRRSTTFPSDEELRDAGWVRISRRDRLITSTPRVGQYFWVDFPHDAYAPEFVDEHPGIVVRAARGLHDTCIIVPLTSRPQDDARHKHHLATNPNPKGQAEGIEAWAICDHLYTVHIARLRPIKDRFQRAIYPQADPKDLQAIFAAIRGSLHRVFPAEQPPPPTPKAAHPIDPNTLSLPVRDSEVEAPPTAMKRHEAP